MLRDVRSNAFTRKPKSMFNVCLRASYNRSSVYKHKQGASEIHVGMISLRPEADDCMGTHFWVLCPVKVSAMWLFVSCEGECDVTISTFTLFNDAVKLTRFLMTKNYETNDNINRHKNSPQIGHALMGLRRRSGLAEGLQSNYIISIVLTNTEWKKKSVHGSVSEMRRQWHSSDDGIWPKKLSQGATRLTYSGCSEFKSRPTYYLDRGGAAGWGTATRWKVAGSIPHSVIGTFHGHNPSGRTMALRSIQPLAEISTRNITWGVKTAGA